MAMQSRTHGEPPQKRQKLETKVFKNADEIRASLQNLETTDASLASLRNQLMVKPGETISPQDSRLSLLQNWLQRDPGLNDLFTIWQNTTSRQTSFLSAIVSLLSSALTLLSSHYMYHALGQPVVKTLLTPVCLRRLNSYIGGSHNELIIVTLKLFLVISTFGGGKERKAILEGFGWEIKSLPKLLNMRRKSKNEEGIDSLDKPDIRTLYILLILSFFEFDSPTTVKTAFLEQHRDAFFSIFKGLVQDHYSVVRKVLEVCWAGLWSDPKVKRSVKISLFNETTITHLIKLYDRVQSDDNDSTHIPADVVHHFLLAICTRPGVGICFKDRGWYPRDPNPEDEKTNKMDASDGPKGGKIYNKILSNVLKTLKVNEDSRQQELALKILSSCPELVAGYWAGAALTLEPRRSSKWIANIAFFGTVISLPVPSPSFLLPNSSLFQPTPPPLYSIIENILPSANNTKAHFSKGLQSSFGIVQHCTALALAKVFAKFHGVIETFGHIAMALEEDPEDGQWSRRLDEVKTEVRRRIPEFQVIVAFSQQKFGEAVVAKSQPPVKTNPTKEALLSESAQRLLWMYQSSLPSVVGEARFDVGKLLQTFSTVEEVQPDVIPNAAARLHHLRQLHVLRLLKASDQFSLIGKPGSSSSSYLHVLLTNLTSTEIIATRSALSSLLEHVLSQSILFQDDPDEPKLWLISLPRTRRGPSAESPDGALLSNEAKSVVDFLDDAVQRCIKNPYKYIEELQALERSSNPNGPHDVTDRLDTYPSPLIMTVLEQLDAKVKKKTSSPSDLLALASFIRKVVYRLSSKLQDLRLLTLISNQFDRILSEELRYAVGFPVMTTAIRREVEILAGTLRSEQVPTIVQEVSEEVKCFLAQVDKITIPNSGDDRIIAAYELVDWLRLVNQPLGPQEMKQITLAVMKFYPAAMQDIFENLAPQQNLSGLTEIFIDLPQLVSFEWLFLHSGTAQILDGKFRDLLLNTVFAKIPTLVELKRVIRLIGHRVKVEFGKDVRINGFYELLALVIKKAIVLMPIADAYALKELVFMRPGVFKDFMMLGSLSKTVQQGIFKLVESSLDPAKPTDRQLVQDISDHWFNSLKAKLISNNASELSTASIWINYFGHDNLLDFLDDLEQSVDAMSSQPVLDILQRVLVAIKLSSSSDAEFESALRHRLPRLLALRSVLHDSAVLEDMISIGIEASIPLFCDRGWLPLDDPEGTSILPIISRAEARWSHHLHQLPPECHIQQFLSQKEWSHTTVKIMSGLLYSCAISHPIFLSWLATSEGGNRDIIHLIPVIFAFLDSSQYCADPLPLTAEIWTPFIPRLVDIITDHGSPRHLRISAGSSVLLLSQFLPSHSEAFIETLLGKVNSQAATTLTVEIIALGSQFHLQSIGAARPLIIALIDNGMQWLIRQLAGEYKPADVDEIIHELASLIKSIETSKAHLVETLLAVIIQDALSNTAALQLATICLSTTSLKPLVVNRHLQSIVQHTQFFKLCNAKSTSLSANPRDAIIDLLSTLFHLHPGNTCQVSHIEPLIRVYHGTISNSDLQLLSILRLFEIQRKLSITQLFNRWSATPGIATSNSLDALQSLDATLVQRTSLHFPNWRSLHGQIKHRAFAEDIQLYDPVFLLLLFGQMLADNPPTTTSTWIGLFRTNIVSLFIRALSAKDAQLREVALCQLTALWKHLQATQLQESPHVLHILDLLKNVLPRPSHEPCIRLPSFTTLTLCHALKSIFYPSSFIYPITARFLLQRPELDTHDVPMLYGMLYSSSDDWKKERNWIIRFLSDGLMSTDDWRIFRRRHTWELIASLFQSSNADESLRNGILEVLANLTSNRQATTSLILKSNLLTWIEAQLIHTASDTLGWIRILENILVMVDPEKIETHTNGEWRSVVCRCLSLLLDDIAKTSNLIFLPAAVVVVLRLSLLSGNQVPGLSILVHRCTECLKIMEQTLIFPPLDVTGGSKLVLSQPPHTAIALHITTSPATPLQTWGACVEMLWRIAMSAEEKLISWDALMSRLLLWHTVSGGNSVVGEWARSETIRNFLV